MPTNPFIPTPLNAGPLASDSYTWNITGLTAGAIYEYQSYFIVDGISYYGNVLTGTTGAPPMNIASVSTGIANTPTTSSYYVTGNMITNKNGILPILEYGILYTKYLSYNTNSTLVYTNIGSSVLKVSNNTDITTGTTFAFSATSLPANTNTWYRAFARNAIGVGYGTIKTAITAQIPAINEVVLLNQTFYDDTTSISSVCSGGNVIISPLLTTAGQSITVDYSVNHFKYPSNNLGSHGERSTIIYCKPSGCASFVSIATYNTDLVTQTYSGSFTMNCGDCICYYNQVACSSLCPSTISSTLQLTSTTSSSNILSSISPTNNCNLISIVNGNPL